MNEESLPLRAEEPSAEALPLLVDCPHSGRDYPADFDYAAPLGALRRLEDAYVDRLCADAPALGATLLVATFPRSYIDPNRPEHDLDTSMLDGPWPGAVRAGGKSDLGVGLIARELPEAPIYDRVLSVAEVRARIERCYRPYHRTLGEALERLVRRFGVAYHLDFHSMPAGDPGQERPDFCVGDADGETSESAFTALVCDWLSDRRFEVAVNDPYPGAEIIRRHGRPAAGRHCLQIEINRALYLDESAVAPGARFEEIRALVTELIATAGEYARSRAAGRGA